MTGFGEARGAHGVTRWRWEARSVNGRGLDIRFRVPGGYESLEAGARTLTAERFKRGSLQLVLTTASEEAARGFRIDPAALADAVKIAKRIAEETGLAPARVDGLLALKGVVIQEESAALDDEAAPQARRLAFGRIGGGDGYHGGGAQNRRQETRSRADVGSHRDRDPDKEASLVAAHQPGLLREKLLAQLAELLEGKANLSEERIAQEVAMLAARADLREETDRLLAHCQEARSLMAAKEPAGRKLDFLAQEFNREANTLCSKSSDIQLTHIGLALKAVIDQFREQVQNVE